MNYGLLFTALAYVVGLVIFAWESRRRGFDRGAMFRIVAAAIFGGAIGARLSQFIYQGWPMSVPAAAIADPATGGRAILGGVIGGWIAVEITKRVMGLRRRTGDAFALALAGGESIGRVGCFFNECCWGVTCSAPWAVYQHDAWRHPAQLYSAVVAACIFATLLLLRSRFQAVGALFRLYLLLFGGTRFLLEFVRYRDSLHFGLSVMQWFCLELIAVAIVGFVLIRRSQKAQLSEVEA